MKLVSQTRRGEDVELYRLAYDGGILVYIDASELGHDEIAARDFAEAAWDGGGAIELRTAWGIGIYDGAWNYRAYEPMLEAVSQ